MTANLTLRELVCVKPTISPNENPFSPQDPKTFYKLQKGLINKEGLTLVRQYQTGTSTRTNVTNACTNLSNIWTSFILCLANNEQRQIWIGQNCNDEILVRISNTFKLSKPFWVRRKYQILISVCNMGFVLQLSFIVSCECACSN